MAAPIHTTSPVLAMKFIRDNWTNKHIKTATLLDAKVIDESWICPQEYTVVFLRELENLLIVSDGIKKAPVRTSKSQLIEKIVRERDMSLALDDPSPEVHDPSTRDDASATPSLHSRQSTTDSISVAMMKSMFREVIREEFPSQDKDNRLKQEIESLKEHLERAYAEIKRLTITRASEMSEGQLRRLVQNKTEEIDYLREEIDDGARCFHLMLKNREYSTESILRMGILEDWINPFHRCFRPRKELMTGRREDLIRIRDEYLAAPRQ